LFGFVYFIRAREIVTQSWPRDFRFGRVPLFSRR